MREFLNCNFRFSRYQVRTKEKKLNSTVSFNISPVFYYSFFDQFYLKRRKTENILIFWPQMYRLLSYFTHKILFYLVLPSLNMINTVFYLKIDGHITRLHAFEPFMVYLSILLAAENDFKVSNRREINLFLVFFFKSSASFIFCSNCLTSCLACN